MMKRHRAVAVFILVASVSLSGFQIGYAHQSGGSSHNQIDNTLQSNLWQHTTAIGGGNAAADSTSISSSWAGGGSADSLSYSEAGDSSAMLYYAPTSVSNYKTRTPPLMTYPPSLPFWTHGGWGALNAYFPNAPSSPDSIYERVFDPSNPDDIAEVHGVLASLSYEGPLQAVAGLFFGTRSAIHHGRGFEIANGLIRDQRPDGKPLLVFIDNNVDAGLLRDEGYAYVGRLSVEGRVNRNWDHVYKAAVAEALRWDVDILLISGGMKGVTVGNSVTFPNAALGFGQAGHSLSLSAGGSQGVTEGKGRPMLSASGYRLCQELIRRREIPADLYNRIRSRPSNASAPAPAAPVMGSAPEPVEMPTATASAKPTAPAPSTPSAAIAPAPATSAEATHEPMDRPVVSQAGPSGIGVSRQLYDMAGFQQGKQISNVVLR